MAIFAILASSCDSCVDVETRPRDAAPDTAVEPLEASLVNVVLDASQAFQADAQTHLSATTSITRLPTVNVVIAWGDGTTTDLGDLADASAVTATHQYEHIGTYTVVATLCHAEDCLDQTLGTVEVSCATAGTDDCSGGITDGCETNVDADLANCGHCGTVCDASSGVCDAADTCVAGVCQPNHEPTTTECRASAGVCDVAETCDGAGACPVDGFAAVTVECRASTDACDAAEMCTGTDAVCPTDVVAPAATVCRAAAGGCDVAEVCDGTATACPADAFVAAATECRAAAAGGCDVAEACSGTDAQCPTDVFQPATVECRAQNGTCDVAETCTGTGATCPADGFEANTVPCRPSAGVCDVAEICTGADGTCPADSFVSGGTECRGSAGICDVAEVCTGSDAACPAEAFVSAGTECRGSAGVCDVAESCTGSGAACPADAVAAVTVSCRGAAGICDVAEFCDGSAVDCPTDSRESTATVCRPQNGSCDVAETCDGSAVDCPGDGFTASGIECRAQNGSCDVAEVCTGSAGACPADSFVAAGIECRGQNGSCDVAEVCTGSAGACPADSFVAAGTSCRNAADICDAAEVCTGAAGACPVDARVPAGTVCRAAGGVCDVAETCDGTAVACPADALATSATVCRTQNGLCDSAETCTGSSVACPADAFVAAGTTCRATSGLCDVAETCTGSAGACPADGFVAAGTSCRASAGGCDVVESCTGSAAACPADSFLAAGTSCRASAGACDPAETCSGGAAACPGDARTPAGTVCRASGGSCDVAETCNGTAVACPADGFVASGTTCRASAGACDVAEACNGSAAACPANAFVASGTTCRNSAGVCDVVETCSGSAAACPADAFASSSTVCRMDSDGTLCDAAESCSGSAAACPADSTEPVGTACTGGGTCQAGGSCAVVFGPDPTFGGGDGDVEAVSPSPGQSEDNNRMYDGARITAGTHANKLLVVGQAYGSLAAATIGRYNANGTIDTTFGTGGTGYIHYTNTNGNGGPDYFQGVIPLSDGKIIVCGYSAGGLSQDDILVARLNEDGSYDTGFGTGGRFSLNGAAGNTNSLDRAQACSLQSDGKILVTGISRLTNGSTNAMFVLRLNANGTADSSFGGPSRDNATDAVGVVSDTQSAGASSNPTDNGAGVVATAAGIYVAGNARAPSTQIRGVLWRLTSDGRRDTTWDGDGRLVATSDGTLDAVEIDGSGRPVVVGVSINPTTFFYSDLIGRATTGGAWDSTFAGGGMTTWAPSTLANGLEALAFQTDGKFVVGGVYSMGTNDNAMLTGRFNANGTIDTSFSGDGYDLVDNPSPNGALATRFEDSVALDVLAGGQIVNYGGTERAAGAQFTNSYLYDSLVVQYTTAGARDTTFGGGDGIVNSGTLGWRTDVLYDVALQSDGKIFGVGYTNVAGGGTSSENASLWRFNANGTADTSFGSGGGQYYDLGASPAVREQLYGVAMAGGDQAVACGYRSNAGGGGTLFSVFKYTTAGALDTAFNTTGFRSSTANELGGATAGSSVANDVVIQTDGKIVAVGSTSTASSGTDMVVVRLNANGSYDTGFAGDGSFNHHNAGGSESATSAETGFAVALQTDGKIIVAGAAATGMTGGRGDDLVVWRVNTNGTLDTSFNGTGFVATGAASASGSRADGPRSVRIQADGKIVVGGFSTDANGALRATVWRFLATGPLDTSFNGTGYFVDTLPSPSGIDQRSSIVIDGSSRIYLVWTRFVSGGGQDLSIWRLTTAGALDSTFATAGVYTQHNAAGGNGRDYGHGALIDGSNRLVVGGQSRGAGTNDMDGIVWRFQ